MASLTSKSRGTRPAGSSSDPVSPYLPLESCARGRQGVSRDILIHMHRLRMLSEIVESREASRAMTLKRSFSRMFPASKVSPTIVSIDINTTYRICLAKCSLRVKLSVHGGKSVQKNRWPFFFFDGLCESPSMLSLSVASSSFSSSSPSPISTSCDCCCDLSVPSSLRVDVTGSSKS